MSEVRNALGYLRGLAPHKMIYAAPEVLSRELAFARTMISTVRGSLWLPQRMHIDDEGADPHHVDDVQGGALPEADLALERHQRERIARRRTIVIQVHQARRGQRDVDCDCD